MSLLVNSSVEPLWRTARWPNLQETINKYPALLRMLELLTLTDLAQNAIALIYFGSDKHLPPEAAKTNE